MHTCRADAVVATVLRTPGRGSATIQRVPAGVAQLAEQPSCKRQVTSSILVTGSRKSATLRRAP